MTLRYAGVLPYAFDEYGEVWLLLGQERECRNAHTSRRWSDFGGMLDNDPPMHAAAREAYEESMGLLGGPGDLIKHISHRESIRGAHGQGVHYCLEMQLDRTLPIIFERFYRYACDSAERSRAELPGASAGMWEKIAMEWIPLRTIEKSCALRREFAKDLPGVYAYFNDMVERRERTAAGAQRSNR